MGQRPVRARGTWRLAGPVPGRGMWMLGARGDVDVRARGGACNSAGGECDGQVLQEQGGPGRRARLATSRPRLEQRPRRQTGD